MNDILSVRDISKNFGELPIVRRVGLTLGEGEFVTLLGKSGSGKSTLLGLLAGLESPSSGEVFLDGRNLAELNEDELALLRREKVGFVFQAFHLIPTLPAVENVAFPLYPTRVPPSERKERARELLAKVGLENRAEHLPAKLSGGERQRVAVARALINRPRLLLCDEPTGNLDSGTGKEIIDLIARLHRENGVSVFMVTHDREMAGRSDRVLHMRDGEVFES